MEEGLLGYPIKLPDNCCEPQTPTFKSGEHSSNLRSHAELKNMLFSRRRKNEPRFAS